MCLNLKDNFEKKVAEKDIVCYKHLQYGYYPDDQILITPYRKALVKLGNTYKSNIDITTYNEVTEALHSFKYKKDCLEDAYCEIKSRCRNSNKLDYVVVRCIIPQGSVYYEGDFCQYKCYASDTLTYVKIVKKILRYRLM
jgi:hypothetical protein